MTHHKPRSTLSTYIFIALITAAFVAFMIPRFV